MVREIGDLCRAVTWFGLLVLLNRMFESRDSPGLKKLARVAIGFLIASNLASVGVTAAKTYKNLCYAYRDLADYTWSSANSPIIIFAGPYILLTTIYLFVLLALLFSTYKWLKTDHGEKGSGGIH